MEDDIYSMYIVYNVPKKKQQHWSAANPLVVRNVPEKKKKKKHASSRAEVLRHVTFGWGVELEDL